MENKRAVGHLGGLPETVTSSEAVEIDLDHRFKKNSARNLKAFIPKVRLRLEKINNDRSGSPVTSEKKKQSFVYDLQESIEKS